MSDRLKFIDDDGVEKDDMLLLDEPIKDFDAVLKNTDYSVYALTGNWGSGKTTFIKLWERTLKQEDYIHIDAFEMDYETEPFIMFIRCFHHYFKTVLETDKKLLEDFTNKAKIIGARLLKVGVNIAVSKLAGSDNAKAIFSDISGILLDELITIESKESSLHEQLKDILNEITAKIDKPIYIVVDELDRCRPSFAMETLEKIKHIFQIKNFKFILVYNNYIFERIIEKTYGITNGNNYMEKFIQKEIPIDNDRHFSNWFFKEVKNDKGDMPKINDLLWEVEQMHHTFSELKKNYDLSLRNFRTLITNIKKYKIIRGTKDLNNIFLVIVAIEVLKILDHKNYDWLKCHVENNGNLNDKNSELKLFLDLLGFAGLKFQPVIQPIFEKINSNLKYIIRDDENMPYYGSGD